MCSCICDASGRLRRAKWIQAVLVAAIALMLLSGQSRKPGLGPLEGSSLVLRTESGRVWLRADSSESGGELNLYSAEPTPEVAGPQPGINFHVSAERKFIAVGTGEPLPLLYLGAEGTRPGILLHRPDMSLCAQIGPDSNGDGVFLALDRSGDLIWAGPPDATLRRKGDVEDD